MSAAPAPRDAEPLKLRQKAYASFTEKLLKRDIRPGQFVSQRELVEITGMPLGAIRELIPRLEADGLITTIPQRGMQVAHVDLSLIRNAFQFRLFLEREAAAIFAANAPDPVIADLRARHTAILREAKKDVTPDLIARAQAVDWHFHDTIVDFLGNPIVSDAYRVNSIKIRLIRQQQTRLYDALVIPVMQEHLRVIDVFQTHDPARSADAIARHIEDARARATGL